MRTRPVDWLVCVAVALVGGLFLFVGAFGTQQTSPEPDRTAPLIAGGVLSVIGLWGIRSCYRNRHAEPLNPVKMAAAWNDPKRVRFATILCSVAPYQEDIDLLASGFATNGLARSLSTERWDWLIDPARIMVRFVLSDDRVHFSRWQFGWECRQRVSVR